MASIFQDDAIGRAAAARPQRWRADALPWWGSAALAGFVWLLLYAIRFGLDIWNPPAWVQSFDQSRYVASALGFAHGDLSAATHWYPLGYALLAAPFAWILPQEPFFLVDLALFVACVLAFVGVARRMGVGPLAATLTFLLGTMVHGKLADLWTRPWTTTLSAPLFWALIAQVLALVEPDAESATPRPRAMLVLGLLAGALPLVRPADGLMGALAVLAAFALLWRQRRLDIAGVAWVALGGLALVVPYALLHLAIYGPQATEYARGAAAQGFAFADLPWKAYVVLVSAAPWFPDAPSLIELMPWVLPGLAGLGLLWWRGDARTRTALALIALIGVPHVVMALAYTDLQPPGLWRFKNAHYFKWLFPLLALGFWVWLRELRRPGGARPALVGLALVLAPMLIRPMPVAVAEDVPARMLMFRGATDRDWNTAYFAKAVVRDARGVQDNVGQFHQVPDRAGQRAVAVKRLFVGPAVRDDPGEAAAYRSGQKPYARYAVRLSPGVPCWLRVQRDCRIEPPAAR